MIKWIRNNIGAITSSLGLLLLVLLMFGNPFEIDTVEYWQNVANNIMSLSLLGFGLVLVNVTIKQGISEQALSAGLNTPNTTECFRRHKDLVKRAFPKRPHLQEFLKEYNARETALRRMEFLEKNNITLKILQAPKPKFKIRLLRFKYNRIKTIVTPASIRWATTTVVYDRQGRIQTLGKYRAQRAVKGVISGTIIMFGMTLIARGLFLSVEEINWLAQTLQLLVYVITIAVTSIFGILKNYEKGAFGVPNELEEINSIWEEFLTWEPKEINDEEKSSNI